MSDENAGKSEKSEGKSSNTFDQYEYVSVIAPGAALLLGVVYLFPKLKPEINDEHSGLASLGLLLIVAFIAGHLLAGIGELFEKAVWWLCGGMPSDWVVYPNTALIDPGQREKFKKQVKERFDLELDEVRSKNGKINKGWKSNWQSITRQIYAAVRAANRNARIDVFNRTYGFCRNLAAAIAVLLFIVILRVAVTQNDMEFPLPWVIGVLAFALALAAGRSFYFGKLYGRELLVTYIGLPPEEPARPGLVT